MMLKPCAHCAKGRVEFVDAPAGEPALGRYVNILCRGCGMGTPRYYYDDLDVRDAVATIARDVWNRRDHVETH